MDTRCLMPRCFAYQLVRVSSYFVHIAITGCHKLGVFWTRFFMDSFFIVQPKQSVVARSCFYFGLACFLRWLIYPRTIFPAIRQRNKYPYQTVCLTHGFLP